MIPDIKVWLKKVDFEVDPGANNGKNFKCHIVVPHTQDLYDSLQGMDAQSYFTKAADIENKYKDSVEIFKYDMITGKNQLNNDVKISYTKAKGAFVFAEYLTPGKFAENIGSSPMILVKFLPYKMEVKSGMNLDSAIGKLKG